MKNSNYIVGSLVAFVFSLIPLNSTGQIQRRPIPVPTVGPSDPSANEPEPQRWQLKWFGPDSYECMMSEVVAIIRDNRPGAGGSISYKSRASLRSCDTWRGFYITSVIDNMPFNGAEGDYQIRTTDGACLTNRDTYPPAGTTLPSITIPNEMVFEACVDQSGGQLTTEQQRQRFHIREQDGKYEIYNVVKLILVPGSERECLDRAGEWVVRGSCAPETRPNRWYVVRENN
jgi:hypothetical protein